MLFFYSYEHEPVHVHARYQGRESKIELIISEGKVIQLNVLDVKGKKLMAKKQLSDFKDLVSKLSDEIV